VSSGTSPAEPPRCVLVTGANGFIGSALCKHFEQHGIAVRRAVRTGAPALAGSTVAVGDVGPATDWSEALSGVDAVVHLAARVHVMRDAAADPLAEFRRVNAEGTRRLAQMAAQAGVRRMLLVSSVKVNGEGAERPYTEAVSPRPGDPYGISKWEAEQALTEIGGRSAMQWSILRPPLVYGPGVGGNFLALLAAVARGLPLPVGAIHNRRSLIYVGNLVDAIRVCLVYPRAANELFLVSDGEDLSSPDLVKRLAVAMDRQARIVSVPLWLLRAAGILAGRQAAVGRLTGSLSVDIARLRGALGWRPPCAVNEGLRNTARWYLESRHQGSLKPG
jgi:nucleoside-diphosphate-sugar epimerase